MNDEVRIPIPTIKWRFYQERTWDYWRDPDATRAVEVWARRCGKDLCYMNIANWRSCHRKGLYLHFLPEFAHARRTIWDGFTNEGERLIDAVFPYELRAGLNEQEMRIELKNGSVWQLGGSDQYNRWVGSNPVGIVYSEFALAHPKGWELMRPILKINGGWAAFIGTPRGYNHLYQMAQLAKKNPKWHYRHLTALEAGIMTQADIDQEIEEGMPDELARQEYLCDFSAANVGAILGKWIEAAEKSGRITTDVYDYSGERIDLSADIGYHDTATWWFWQPWYDGFGLVDYDEDNGLDAQQWIERLANKPWKYGTIYLPHDAKAKTFQSRHSVIMQFLQAVKDEVIDAERVVIVPQTAIKDRINAARTILPSCRFDVINCAQGLMGLREWSFKWDEERKVYSKEPEHNWASHPGDGFSYGAQMMKERVKPVPKPRVLDPRTINNVCLEDLWAEREHDAYRRERID